MRCDEEGLGEAAWGLPGWRIRIPPNPLSPHTPLGGGAVRLTIVQSGTGK